MKQQSIKKNYIFNTAYQILTMLTPLVTAPYISRVLGAEGVGVYSYTSSVVAFFTMFAVLGTSTYGQRAIAQCRDDMAARSRTFWEIECLSLLTTAAALLAWFLFILVSRENRLYFLILSVEIVSVAFDITWFFAGLERFSLIVLRNAVIKLLSVALVFICIRDAGDTWVYVTILAAGKFAGNISMWLPLREQVSRVSIRELHVWPHAKETVAYFIPTAAASVYSHLDKVMIGAFTETSVENGWYAQANRIVSLAYMLLSSLNTVMSARMSYLFANGRESEMREKLENALTFILTLGVPLVFGIIGVARNFVPWFFGEGFDEVVFLMQLASPLVVIMSLHNFLSVQYLIPSGQRVRSTKGVFVGAGMNFVCNLLLIPRFRAVGAVIGTLIAESSIVAVYMYMSREYVPVRLLGKHLTKQLIAGAVMLPTVLLIGRGHSGSILITVCQVAAGALVYFAVLLLLREEFVLKTSTGIYKKAVRKIKRG